jgi:hypothetical protein
MEDGQGRLVPLAVVNPIHKLEDGLVRELFAEGEKASAALRSFKERVRGDLGAFLDLLADKYNAARGGQRGNVTFTSYDGMLRVQLAIGDQLAFGSELEAAKALVDDCIHAWSEGIPPELQAIINNAFDVDKKGKINIGAILRLRRLEIRDEKWQRAMTAIGDALRIESSKEYVRFYRRPARDARWEQLPLDLASV